MLYARLLNRIEENWEQIARSVAEQPLRDTNVSHYARLDESEIRARCLDVVQNLSGWLTGRLSDGDLRERYGALGARRLREGFPLEEVIYKLQSIEWHLEQYAGAQDPPHTAVDLYREHEIQRALHRFFCIAVHSVVVGYERGRELQSPAAA